MKVESFHRYQHNLYVAGTMIAGSQIGKKGIYEYKLTDLSIGMKTDTEISALNASMVLKLNREEYFDRIKYIYAD
jgi:hypothetical protein